jgi:hypothetical protein
MSCEAPFLTSLGPFYFARMHDYYFESLEEPTKRTWNTCFFHFLLLQCKYVKNPKS